MSNINVGYNGGQVVWLGSNDSIMHVILPASLRAGAGKQAQAVLLIMV